MSKEWSPETVFDVLGCEISRRILALGSLEAVSAQELAEYCEVSLPTVYRRIGVLQKYDMLDEQREIDDDGHHYKTYRTNLKEARIRVEDGGFHIDIQLEKDYADKFGKLRPDLERGPGPHRMREADDKRSDRPTRGVGGD